MLILIGTQPFCNTAAASLDDPSWYQLEMDIFTSRAHPWDVMDPALPKFPAMPSPMAVSAKEGEGSLR